ncbi:MAG TPA: type I-A CRISPR-associated protein Cas5 [Candidatus Bathyarchaeota archaeon]|nr:type I-A CRISPR-associated protein Cas5 [Candidatus Bathyarchaeota archaeon]
MSEAINNHLILVEVNLKIPLFAVKPPYSWGARLTYILPPPTTLLGALGKCIGNYLDFPGEASICISNEDIRFRTLLQSLLESTSFAAVTSYKGEVTPVIKSYQMHRVVQLEKGNHKHDAFEHEYVSTSGLCVSYIVNTYLVEMFTDSLASKMQNNEVYLIEEIRETLCNPLRLERSVKLLDRLGYSECLGSVDIDEVHVTSNPSIWLKEENSIVKFNTYTPIIMLSSLPRDIIIQNLKASLWMVKWIIENHPERYDKYLVNVEGKLKKSSNYVYTMKSPNEIFKAFSNTRGIELKMLLPLKHGEQNVRFGIPYQFTSIKCQLANSAYLISGKYVLVILPREFVEVSAYEST